MAEGACPRVFQLSQELGAGQGHTSLSAAAARRRRGGGAPGGGGGGAGGGGQGGRGGGRGNNTGVVNITARAKFDLTRS